MIETSGAGASAAFNSALAVKGDLDFRMVDSTVDSWDLEEGRVPPGTEIMTQSGYGNLLAVRRIGGLSGRYVIEAVPGFDVMTDEPVVSMTFNEEGAEKLARLTEANVGEMMAMVLDGEVIMAPIINEPIILGQMQVSGNFTQPQTHELAAAITSGELPVPFVVVDQRALGQ